MADRVWIPKGPMSARELRQREPRERDDGYKAWIAQLPCIACLVMGQVKRGVHVAHVRLTDADHGWRGAGMQEKPHDRRCTPLCPGHHQHFPNSQHRYGDERGWWFDLMRVDVFALCANLSDAFDRKADGAAIIARHAAAARRKDTA